MEARKTSDTTLVAAGTEIRFSRDNDGQVTLDAADLEKLWENLPHGASPRERDEIYYHLIITAETIY